MSNIRLRQKIVARLMSSNATDAANIIIPFDYQVTSTTLHSTPATEMPKRSADDNLEKEQEDVKKDENGLPLKPRPSPDPRVYYDEARVFFELRQLCPYVLPYMPHTSTFGFHRGTPADGLPMAAMRIGCIWVANQREELLVVDKGAYYSDPPDLAPYNINGQSRRHIVNETGFSGTGIFESFNEVVGPTRKNIAFNNPFFVSLVQFMFILGGKRRYYSYNGPHESPPDFHLSTLANALCIATLVKREPRLAGIKPGPSLPSFNDTRPPMLRSSTIQASQMMQAQQMVPQQNMMHRSQTLQQPQAGPYPNGIQPTMISWQDHQRIQQNIQQRQAMQYQLINQHIRAHTDPMLTRYPLRMARPGANTTSHDSSDNYKTNLELSGFSLPSHIETERPKKRGRPCKELSIGSRSNVEADKAARDGTTCDRSPTVAAESDTSAPPSAGTEDSDANSG